MCTTAVRSVLVVLTVCQLCNTETSGGSHNHRVGDQPKGTGSSCIQVGGNYILVLAIVGSR